MCLPLSLIYSAVEMITFAYYYCCCWWWWWFVVVVIINIIIVIIIINYYYCNVPCLPVHGGALATNWSATTGQLTAQSTVCVVSGRNNAVRNAVNTTWTVSLKLQSVTSQPSPGYLRRKRRKGTPNTPNTHTHARTHPPTHSLKVAFVLGF